MRKLTKCVFYSLVIISLISLLFIGHLNLNSVNDKKNILYTPNPHNPIINISSGPINSSQIFLNDTEIITLFDTIQIDLNATGYPTVNYTNIQFIYTDGTTFIDQMTFVSGVNFTYNYSAPYNIPTGIHSIFFQIYDENDFLLNDNQTETTFLVKSNYYTAEFLNNELFLGDLLSVELSIKNTTEHNFTYNVSIVDSIDEQVPSDLIFLGNDLDWFNITVEGSIFNDLNTYYYVKVNLTEQATGQVNATYFPFKILNHNPQIIESTVTFSSLEIFRSNTNNAQVSLNITDVEDDPNNLTVIMHLMDQFGNAIHQFVLSNTGNSFLTDFGVDTTSPTGTYKANITATDLNGGISSFTTEIEVKNNPPQFNLYLINGQLPTQSISIDYGENIILVFDITDLDNDIEYITVNFISENSQIFSVSTVNKLLVINSAELISGEWYIYISATDSEGETINLNSDYGLAPQKITIRANTLENLVPWITLAIGIIVGLLIGIAFAYNFLKSRRKVKEEETTKKSKSEKASKIQKISEPTPESKEKLTEEEKRPEKPEKETSPTKKKIKRRL
ncbi:MAG: hypothetical protein BAJALOKI1v1_80025 [Promethearchaeota archaeon]|nr:MAG: hypothetical protein BAJALOKI1v1_80025 [Candidatus Lokiarchaeota archaeon]